MAVLLASPFLHAQAKDAFLASVIDFINAAGDTAADGGVALGAAVDAMSAGLAEWDSRIGRAEAGLASDIGAASPATAARMRTALGAVYLERGRFEAALTQFDLAGALDPSLPTPHVLRGLALDSTARPDEAADAYRRAWERDSASAVNAYQFLRVTRGTAAAADVSAAVDALRAMVEAPRTIAAPPPAFDLALPPLLPLLDDAMSPSPVIPFAAYADGFALLRQGRYDEAVARFRDAVAADAPGAADARAESARLAAADAHVASGDTESARRALRETLQAYPDSGRASWKLGTLLQALGDERGATEALERAAGRAIVGAGGLFATLGRLYHRQLDLDAAVAAYERHAALRPDDSAAHYALAEVFRARDDLDSARVEALAAALLDPTTAGPLVMIGQLDAAAGRDDAALGMLRRAVDLAPADPEARYALGRTLVRLGRTDEARRELEVFRRLQSQAMEEERRRVEQNQSVIDDALKAEPGKETGR